MSQKHAKVHAVQDAEGQQQAQDGGGEMHQVAAADSCHEELQEGVRWKIWKKLERTTSEVLLKEIVECCQACVHCHVRLVGWDCWDAVYRCTVLVQIVKILKVERADWDTVLNMVDMIVAKGLRAVLEIAEVKRFGGHQHCAVQTEIEGVQIDKVEISSQTELPTGQIEVVQIDPVEIGSQIELPSVETEEIQIAAVQLGGSRRTKERRQRRRTVLERHRGRQG